MPGSTYTKPNRKHGLIKSLQGSRGPSEVIIPQRERCSVTSGNCIKLDELNREIVMDVLGGRQPLADTQIIIVWTEGRPGTRFSSNGFNGFTCTKPPSLRNCSTAQFLIYWWENGGTERLRRLPKALCFKRQSQGRNLGSGLEPVFLISAVCLLLHIPCL